MKFFVSLLIAISVYNIGISQVSGNVNYQSRTSYPEHSIELSTPLDPNLVVSVKGMINLKADNYVAIFSVTQFGKTPEEVNSLIDSRISQVTSLMKANPELLLYVDMISFVPVYEFETEKKIFSKRTYNEVPKGFEVKKNIHIKYTNPNLLNEIIMNLASAEIYDLVRVDYFSDKMEKSRIDLMTKARLLLQQKIRNDYLALGIKTDSLEKNIVDGFSVVYPVESYRSYQAYSNSSLNLKKPANVNEVQKSTTLYYQPFMDKDFDFVINPTIVEPVIQLMYEVKVMVNRTKPQKEPARQYLIITPTGDLKSLDLERVRQY